MRIALTGATGIVGGFIAEVIRQAGHKLNTLPGFRLGDQPDMTGHDALIHAAFSHVPGRYRGGEGDDPAAFQRQNLDGSLCLFDAAIRAGVGKILFMSSRAVHDGYPAGTILFDDLPVAPTTLYGQIKADTETALAALPIASTALRATGVYGAGRANKWRGLFADYLSGQPISPRVATEVHGADMANAVLLALRHDAPATLNVSDIVLDHHDLLAEVAQLTGSKHALPARAEAAALRIPDCTGLIKLGWRPGGMTQLRNALPGMLDHPVNL